MSEVIEQSNRNHRILAIMAGVFGGLAIGFTALTIPFITPAFRRIVLPFVPATNTQIENVLKAIEYRRPFESPLTKELKIIDLGSGDGRVVIACAKQGWKSFGVELNLWLVLYSKFRAFRENVRQLTSFQQKNLFKQFFQTTSFYGHFFRLKIDLAEYDNIIVFGVDNLMPLIEDKIRKDCDRSRKQMKLIACRFPLPNWKSYMTFGSGVDQVWLYNYYPSYHKSYSTL
ncbi:methyltransferase-like protein 3 [Sarcoptes scabiei]|uniref:Methyltransferase-like protein 3 n=1 Tax=Sarcoptes scabiei TaxID=52283 RepID=A0A132A0A2_SARSC|nr:methyltransferase-like protein 3 [Sarcoptes scabiei]